MPRHKSDVCIVSSFLPPLRRLCDSLETAKSENWILNVGQAREFQCFFFILHNRKLAFIAFSQKTLSIDFASCCARWNFCTWKKEQNWNETEPPCCWRRWTVSGLVSNISNSYTMYKKDVVCLLLCPGACWDVVEDGVVIRFWATADEGSEHTSLRA